MPGWPAPVAGQPVIVIRTARLAERLALIELQRRASLANPGDRAVIEAHPEAVDTPAEQFEAGQVFVAEFDGAVQGFSALVPRADGDLELDALFVDPAMWRRGIAMALIADGVQRARTSGIEAIRVIGNPHARAFYLAAGFVETGPTQTEFGPASTYLLTIPRAN